MSCTVNCPKCGENIPVNLVVDKDFVPSNPSLERTGSSRDYDNFSDLDEIPSPVSLAHSVDSQYVGMGTGGRKKTRKRFNSYKKKLTKRRK